MPLRTKIEVETEIENFQASVAALNRYRDAIRQSSSHWVRYGASVESALKTAHEVTKQLEGHSISLELVSATHRGLSDAAKRAGSIFANIARDTKSVAEGLARSATSLLSIFSITGIVAGLVGLGGGLFGLEALAGGVTARRREALGLGADYGRVSSFDLNFARYGDPQAILGGVSQGLYDFTSPAYRGLLAAGVQTRGDAAQTAAELMRRLPQIFAGTPQNLVGARANALGLTEIMSVKEIIAYLRSSPSERQSQLEHYEADTRTLTLSRDVQLKWAQFDTALGRAGANIETILADQLVSLADPLSRLSDSVVNLVEAFVGSPALAAAIQGIDRGLEGFAALIGSSKFQHEASSFLEGIGRLGPIARRVFEIAETAIRKGWLIGRVLNPADSYNKSIGGVITDLLDSGSQPAPVVKSVGAGPSVRYHTRGYLDPSTHPMLQTRQVYDDPSIRARQRMRNQQTSYLDQFQGASSKRQLIVSDQTHSNVVISAP